MGVNAKGRRFCDARVYAASGVLGGRVCALKPTVKAEGKDLCRVHSPEGVKARNAKRDARIDAKIAAMKKVNKQFYKEERRREKLDRLLPDVIATLTVRSLASHSQRESLAAKLRRLLP